MVKRNDNVMDGKGPLPTEDKPTFAQQIDASVWFHTLYGALDGLTVSYSTVKFLCDVSAKSTSSYRTHLDNLLTDETWLPILIFETGFITLLSMIGNRASKLDDPNAVQRFCRDYWPYIRDVLKGAKNGYRGVKSLFTACQHLKIFNAADLRSLAIPIGLAVGACALLNRIFIRYMTNKRKALVGRLKDIQDQIKAHDEQHFIQEEERLLGEQKKYHKESLEYLFFEAQLLKNQKAREAACIAFHDALLVYQSLKKDIQQFESSFKYKLLYASSVIGALVDGPYLYAGVLLLGTVPTPFMAISAIILLSMFVGLLCTRLHDEYENRIEFQIAELKTELAIAQKNYQQARLLFEAYLSSHPEEMKNIDALKAALIEFNLPQSYKNYQETDEKLNTLLSPTYKGAALSGVKDGLTFFGALSSIYFSIGIFLFLSGTAFPPALIIAGAFLGLSAIIGFTAKRLHQAKLDKKNFNQYITAKKVETQRANHFFDYNLDCNNDGFTKGQFYFQESFEVIRGLGSGPYKSNNLTDFMLSSLKEEAHDGDKKDSLPMIIFWGGVSLIYGMCQALVAFGKGFSKIKKSKPEDSPTVKTDSTSKTPIEASRDNSVQKALKPPPSAETSIKRRASLTSLSVQRQRFFQTPPSPKESMPTLEEKRFISERDSHPENSLDALYYQQKLDRCQHDKEASRLTQARDKHPENSLDHLYYQKRLERLQKETTVKKAQTLDNFFQTEQTLDSRNLTLSLA